jgi:YHS domain-containing protein
MKEPTRTLFWVELVCAVCADSHPGTWAASKIDVKGMKKEAAQAGWTFEGIHAFCSSSCKTAFEVNEERKGQEKG